MIFKRALGGFALASTLVLAAPASAELNAGYEAWTSGDYARAVQEWRDLAAAGNADAQYNMSQAYRQGKGVEKNEKQAEILLAKAAAQGHIKATDNYGLLLFQSGRREEAMPYVLASAERGNPWAQYLIGIGHFNGDLVEKDWVKAYALMTLANSANYEHARAALAQMDNFIPLAQRQEAQLVAQKLKRDADAKFASQKAAEDLSIGASASVAAPPRQASAATGSPLPSPASRIPQPIERTAIPPSISAARVAVAEAARVTGTESPADAGADFARPSAVPTSSAAPTVKVAANSAPVTPALAAPKAATAPTRGVSADGAWRLQLGAFSVRTNAEKLWSRLAGNPALAGKQKFIVPAGRVVKLQIGGYPSLSLAQAACTSLKRGGQDCIVTK